MAIVKDLEVVEDRVASSTRVRHRFRSSNSTCTRFETSSAASRSVQTCGVLPGVYYVNYYMGRELAEPLAYCPAIAAARDSAGSWTLSRLCGLSCFLPTATRLRMRNWPALVLDPEAVSSSETVRPALHVPAVRRSRARFVLLSPAFSIPANSTDSSTLLERPVSQARAATSGPSLVR